MQSIFRKTSDTKGMLYTWGRAMHTRFDLMLCGGIEEELKNTAVSISGVLHKLELIGNYYDPASELSYLNTHAGAAPVKLTPELYRIIQQCVYYHAITCGCFDIAIHSDAYDKNTLSGVLLNEREQTIHFTRQGIRLNLSGYLKGYALEVIREILIQNNIENALINLGNSSVLAMGNHPYGDGWKVEMELPAGCPKPQPVMLLNQCYTSSGNSTTNSRHIISPETGNYLPEHKILSVVTQLGTEGEAFSTALFAASPTIKNQLINQFKLVTVEYKF